MTALAFLAFLTSTATSSNAGLITSNSGASESNLGAFTGFIGVSNNTPTMALITVTLTNTSPEANGGFITAFAFNDPGTPSGGDITTVTNFTTTDPDFLLLGDPTFSNSINALPFGMFDIGASLSGETFQGGGGNVSQGIGVGQSATFTFNVTGTNLQNLSQASLEAALSSNPGGGGSQFFLVRFRGFENGGSDKVPATPDVAPVPEPGTITMALIGSIPMGLMAWRRRKRAIG